MHCPIIFLLCVVLVVGPAGCAAKQPPLLSLLPPPSEEMRASFGMIGVLPVRSTPEITVEAPSKGRIAGAGRGGGKVAAKGAMVGGALVGMGCSIFCLILVPVGALIGGVTGFIGGALATPSSKAEQKAETTLRAALSDLQMQDMLEGDILQKAEDVTPYHIIPLADSIVAAPGEKVSYRPLAGNGTDTVLEIRVVGVHLETDSGVNHPSVLFMKARARLVRTIDDQVLYDGTIEYRSGRHRFTQWAADGAQLLRETVAQGCHRLAERIVEELFLSHPPELPSAS